MKNNLAIVVGNGLLSSFRPIIISSLKNLKNFLPLSLKKNVTYIVLNQQLDNNWIGEINRCTFKCLEARKLYNSIFLTIRSL